MDSRSCALVARRIVLLAALLLATLVLAGPGPAAAQGKAWTTVGSTGTVDEADGALVRFNGPFVSLPTHKAGTLHIRYNVVAVEGLFLDEGVTLRVRYRDPLDADQVLVRLLEVNIASGFQNTLAILDSNDYAQADALQVQAVCNPDVRFNFDENAYWIEAELTKTKVPTKGELSVPSPNLEVIQLLGSCVSVPR